MKIKIICVGIVVACISLLVYEKCYKKQDIYIMLEDLEGFSYSFKKDSLGQDKYIKLTQDGRFNYIHWELEIDNNKIREIDYSLIHEIDIVSQYWIINNFFGLKLSMNPTKDKNYDIYVIKPQDDRFYLYPISFLHYLIE